MSFYFLNSCDFCCLIVALTGELQAVWQDLMRVVHHLLPLDRIEKTHGEKPKKACCWERTHDAAFNFANRDRLMQLLMVFDPDWFHPGEIEGVIKYGLRAENVTDAVQALATWMQPRATANANGIEELEKQSRRRTLKFHSFEMTDAEIDSLAGTAVAISHVRWQWVTAWIVTEKEKLCDD